MTNKIDESLYKTFIESATYFGKNVIIPIIISTIVFGTAGYLLSEKIDTWIPKQMKVHEYKQNQLERSVR